MSLEQTLFLLYTVLFLFVFLVGICVGSFLNVLVYRIPNGISFVKGRSFCPKCRTPLTGRDLVPIFSFLFLKGRCRTCKEKISWRYPLIEALTGILFLLVFFRFDFTMQAVTICIAAAMLLTISLIDLDTMTIPNGLVIAMIVPAVLSVFFGDGTGLLSRAIGFFVLSLPMFLLNFLIDDCFGGGDIKLMAVCGFMLGWQNTLLAGFIGLLTGGIAAVALLLAKKKEKKQHIPFGPFLAFGIFIAMMWGQTIIGGYLSFFGLAY